jgi:hypothetical protein
MVVPSIHSSAPPAQVIRPRRTANQSRIGVRNMATPIVSGHVPVSTNPCSEPFAARALAALNGPPESIDSKAQAEACLQRAHVCLRAARAARADGTPSQYARWLRAARMLRFAAHQWRVRAREAS